uniref:Uncharacterized protein n=1 Tax=Panagrolaimus sp. ES5 TaxID=591445 RepID=A0AC34FQ34_9BILA
MDLSTKVIVCPFSIECKFKKADLIALKDSENRFLNGKCFYSFNIHGLQYYVRIFPKGDKERDKTWIGLYVNGSNERKIMSKATIIVESADISRRLDYVYEKYKGYGCKCCKAADFFKPESKFFVNGEVTIKVEGTFEAERPLVMKNSSPISMEWKICKEVLQAENGMQNDFLHSKRKIVAAFSDVKYYLSICVNEVKDGKPPTTRIYLHIEMGHEKKVEAVVDFSIDSGNFSVATQYTFEKSKGYGIALCSTNNFFDSSKGYIVDEFLTINLNGILMIETNGNTDIISKKRNKNFKIVIGDKELNDLVENDLIKKISPSNVVQLIHFSKVLTAAKLQKSSIKFLLKCSKKHTPVLGLESLGKDFLATRFLETFRPADTDDVIYFGDSDEED